MSVLQFPDTFYMIPLQSSGNVEDLGAFSGVSGELNHIMLWMTVIGTSTGTESFTLRLYADSSLNAEVAASTAVAMTDFAVPSNGYNYVRFDFSDVNLNPNIGYRVAMTSTGYTRLGDNFFIGPLLEWAEPFYQSGGLKMAIATEV